MDKIEWTYYGDIVAWATENLSPDAQVEVNIHGEVVIHTGLTAETKSGFARLIPLF